MKDYIKIDENGYAVFNDLQLPFKQRCLDIIRLNEDECIPDDYILSYTNGGFYHPRWTGTEWIEGMTQEKIDALNYIPHQPTQEELILQKVIAILPASVLAQGIEEQYQEDLKILNLESEV